MTDRGDKHVSRYNEQVKAESCYFCSNQDLQTHHIVPQRMNGTDRRENLVIVCESCHQKLERLYDKRFYERLGLSDAKGEERSHFTCIRGECTSRAVVNMKPPKAPAYGWYCKNHAAVVGRPRRSSDGRILEADIRKVLGELTESEIRSLADEKKREVDAERYRDLRSIDFEDP